MKRVVDFCLASVLLLVLLPLLAIVACISLITQGFPIVFKQSRVGRLGENFALLKFRTMVINAENLGAKVTVEGDSRITRWGRILRKTKLDEALQLWNVIKGDMSLVGPRPEVAEYVAMYDEHQKRVLSVRPGITDVASLKYYDESEQLAKVEDPRRHYIDVIMPDKIRMNLEYMDRASLLEDLYVVAKTALRVIFPSAKI